MAALIARLAGLAVPLVAAHPMHTSVTELTLARDGHRVTVSVRVFADDFAAAAGVGDSAASEYVRERLVLTDRSGRRLALRWEAHESRGDALILRLSTLVPAGLAGVEAWNSILCERFHDQVNLVRVTSGSRATTLLFTRGSGPQAVP